MAILTAILSALKAIPALAKLVESLIAEWRRWDAKSKAKEANDRKAAKDAAIDAAIDRAVSGGVHEPEGSSEQPGKTNGQT